MNFLSFSPPFNSGGLGGGWESRRAEGKHITILSENKYQQSWGLGMRGWRTH